MLTIALKIVNVILAEYLPGNIQLGFKMGAMTNTDIGTCRALTINNVEIIILFVTLAYATTHTYIMITE